MYRILQVVLTLDLLIGLKPSMAAEKFLIVGERLVKNDPWRNDLVKLQYEIAMEEAKRDHLKAFPKSEFKLIASFDRGPAGGFDLAAREKAYGVVGYYYSSDAFEASRLALHRKIPFLTAVSPIDAVRNQYSFSLASSHSLIEKKLKTLAQLEDLDNPTIVLTLPTSLANFEYAKIYDHAFNVVETFKGNPEH
ncbi:MAG: hypothetical protein AB8G05_21855 [Oligoflexales bacterium]